MVPAILFNMFLTLTPFSYLFSAGKIGLVLTSMAILFRIFRQGVPVDEQRRRMLHLLFLFLAASIFIGLLDRSQNYAYSIVWFVQAFAVFIFVTQSDSRRVIKVATVLVLFILFLCFVSFFYAIVFKDPTYVFVGGDGRPNYIFLTSFTVDFDTETGRIRPSGIFEEPGLLALLVAFLVIIRDVNGSEKRPTILILVGGMITQSLAYYLFFLIYVLYEMFKKRDKLLNVLVAIVGGLLILLAFTSESTNQRVGKLLAEVEYSISSETIRLDNRTMYIYRSLNAISSDSFSLLSGYGDDCKKSLSCEGRSLDFCCEPLTPLVRHGLFFSLPYYAGMIILLIAVFGKSRLKSYWPAIGLFLLLMQRPALASVGVSFYFMQLMWLSYIGRIPSEK